MSTVPDFAVNGNDAAPRTAFRDAVAAVAAKAHDKLPAGAGRIASAVKLVLLGEVTLLAGGGATVGSCTDPTQTYTVNGHCACQDFDRAPANLCKHRLAYGIARRAAELLPQSTPVETEAAIEVQATPVPVLPAPSAAPLPEAALSLTLKGTLDGREALLTARGQTPAEFHANLAAIRGLLDPGPPARGPGQATKGPAAASADAPQCPTHGAMQRRKWGWSCPGKTPEGAWCKYPPKGGAR